MTSVVPTEIELAEFCSILECSDIIQSLDLGDIIVHVVNSPELGSLTLINSSGGNCIMLK